MPETLTVEEDIVTRITLERPAAGNAITEQLASECIAALEGLADDVRVVILEGAGNHFCTGGDLDEMDPAGGAEDPTEQLRYISENGHEIIRTVRGLDQPVIAKVHGHAVGAGFNLALACDIVVAANDAQFAQIFTRVGLHPDCGGTYLLVEEVGTKAACELIFTGSKIDAAEGYELGFINHIEPAGELEDRVIGLAESIAAGPPVAISLAKESIYDNRDGSLDDALSREALAQMMCLSTRDFAEGVAAYQEGREPSFEGR